MGYIRHDAVVAVAWTDLAETAARVAEFRQGLPEEWQPLVIGPVRGVVNGDDFYAFLPDGSKERWGASDAGDEYRDQFRAWDEGCASGLDAGLSVGEHFMHDRDMSRFPDAPVNPYRQEAPHA